MIGPLRVPEGFLFSSTAAGIKASGKPDVALAFIPDGAPAAAVFTRNLVVAAPVTVGREHLKASRGKLHVVIVNAGNANCATGPTGLKSARAVCQDVARRLRVKTTQVFPSSTGIIGVQLPTEKITDALPRLISSVDSGPQALDAFASAIMTTDTRQKIAFEVIEHKAHAVTLTGVAKGAGMIHPNLATMLVYIFTDLSASPRELEKLLRAAVDESFNNISIDGDTSTNDTVLLLANGKSGVALHSVRGEFDRALRSLCRSLAGQIVSDGEGVKHVVRLKIEQARSRAEARQIARAIANSPLVKTAWAGADPNWGRMLAAIGYSGVRIDPERINIYLGEQHICRNGAACGFDKNAAHEYMMQPAYEVRFKLGSGRSTLEFLTCDLTSEYVHINADYST